MRERTTGKVVGIDISQGQLDFVKRRDPGIEVIQGDMFTIKLDQ